MTELRTHDLRVRVLLAHEDSLGLFALVRALADKHVEVVGEASMPEQILPLVARTDPHILLISLGLAEREACATLTAVVERHPGTRAVVLVPSGGSHGPHENVCAAGAVGILSTAVHPDHLGAVLFEAAAGTVVLVPGAPVPEAEAEVGGLTERELAVLDGAARGLSNDAIGRELWLSPYTVKSHLHRIYGKLDVANRTEAARWALEHGLVGDAATV